MMREPEDRSVEAGKNIKIGSFRRQRHGRSGQRSLTIESGTAERRAKKKMGDGFQEI